MVLAEHVDHPAEPSELREVIGDIAGDVEAGAVPPLEDDARRLLRQPIARRVDRPRAVLLSDAWGPAQPFEHSLDRPVPKEVRLPDELIERDPEPSEGGEHPVQDRLGQLAMLRWRLSALQCRTSSATSRLRLGVLLRGTR